MRSDKDWNEELNKMDLPSKVAVMMIAAHRDFERLEHMAERFSELNEAFELDFADNNFNQLFQQLAHQVEYFEHIVLKADDVRTIATEFVEKLDYVNSLKNEPTDA